eukprot:TRINITY_DN39577_c0_g2_i1.p1 TRINITY_DN39577_c0_g2~~TRINITY_DN39577_c0_g2_i1.p1  ORF type:complete len:404 (+),score=118.20 TRINITY_DN39577_c0_g2_i1:54-1265(+)
MAALDANPPPAKKAKLDEAASGAAASAALGTPAASGGAAASLTAEQLAKIERNRQLALERRQQQLRDRQAADSQAVAEAGSNVNTAKGLTEEQKIRIEERRQAALERRKAAQVAATPRPLTSSGGSAAATASTAKAEAVEQEATQSTSASDSDSDDTSSSSDSSSESEAEQESKRPRLSPELRARIERHRQAALARRKAAEVVKLNDMTKSPDSVPDWFTTEPCGRDPSELAICDYEAPSVKPFDSVEKRDGKQRLVAKLLCRWWYALPDWPPRDIAYYDKRLEARKLRRILIQAFDRVPDVDEDGRTKVFSVPHYPGLFREATGRLWDLRPVLGRPSYDQMMSKTESELHRLVLDAYQNQLKELEAQPIKGKDDEERRLELKKEVKEAKQKASFSAMFRKKS